MDDQAKTSDRGLDALARQVEALEGSWLGERLDTPVPDAVLRHARARMRGALVRRRRSRWLWRMGSGASAAAAGVALAVLLLSGDGRVGPAEIPTAELSAEEWVAVWTADAEAPLDTEIELLGGSVDRLADWRFPGDPLEAPGESDSSHPQRLQEADAKDTQL